MIATVNHRTPPGTVKRLTDGVNIPFIGLDRPFVSAREADVVVGP